MAFNLNIDNYTIGELEDLLNLKTPYSSEDIKDSKKKLKSQLLKKDHMSNDDKSNIVLFLDNVNNKLDSQIPTNSFLESKNEVLQEGGNFVINRPSVQVGMTAKSWEGRTAESSVQPPGYLNPINIATIQRTINIDTRFREQYYQTVSSNFNIVLPEKFTKVTSMRLASIEIPLSFHAISKTLGNNCFTITILDEASCSDAPCSLCADFNTPNCSACNGGGVDSAEVVGYQTCAYLVQLPDGNYEDSFSGKSNAAFIENGMNFALRKAINLNTGEFTNLYDGDSGIRFTVDHVSGRSIFANNVGSTDPCDSSEPPNDTDTCNRRFQINFNVNIEGCIDLSLDLQLNLGWQLGYRAGVYKGASIISEGVCYTVGPRYMYLCVDDYNNNVNNYFTSAFARSVLQKDILARINLANVLQSDGVYKSGQDDGFSTQINRSRSYFGPVSIQRMKISLLDEYGRIINLNSMDWSFALAFECCYD